MLISIDHGNSAIKTPNFTFVSGYIESSVPPAISDECLFFNGKYYSLTEKRIVYRRDKTADDSYFILTLFAIGKELKAAKIKNEFTSIDLAVGLPPEHYGVLRDKYEQYFRREGMISFKYNDGTYNIGINKVMVFPQAYAAVVPQSDLIVKYPRVFIVDIGGYTTDVLLLHNGRPDLSFCKSLDNGVITMYNDIISRVDILHDIKITDEHIREVLTGEYSCIPDDIKKSISDAAEKHTFQILNKLREFGIDLKGTKSVFVGGGSLLLRSFIEQSKLVFDASFVENQMANAKGYELLAQAVLASKKGAK